jgi:hypothetical protein
LYPLDYREGIDFKFNELRAAGVHSGETIYFSCATVHVGSSELASDGAYYDPIHHQTRYSSCGPRSNVVMALMP